MFLPIESGHIGEAEQVFARNLYNITACKNVLGMPQFDGLQTFSTLHFSSKISLSSSILNELHGGDFQLEIRGLRFLRFGN